MQIQKNAWMQPTIQCEHMAGEQGILTMLTWSYGGNEVAIEGSWDNWEARYKLYLSEFHAAKNKIKQNKIMEILKCCFMMSLFDFVPFYIY